MPTALPVVFLVVAMGSHCVTPLSWRHSVAPSAVKSAASPPPSSSSKPHHQAGPTYFDACIMTPLRAADVFTPARIAIPLFRCLTAHVLFPYHPPPGVLVSLYRPLCVMVRMCTIAALSGGVPSPRMAVIQSQEDLFLVTTCFRTFYSAIMHMGAWDYYKMHDWLRAKDNWQGRNSSRDMTTSVVTKAFMAAMACVDDGKIDPDVRITTDTGIAILRWIMEKIL